MKKLINILDFLPEELENEIKPMFHVKQLCQWIYQKYVNDFDAMSSLSKDLRLKLGQKYHFSPLVNFPFYLCIHLNLMAYIFDF